MKRSSVLFAILLGMSGLRAQQIDIRQTEAISPYIFGHNLEHTRAAVGGGLSAQMLKNRKFAGKPSAGKGVLARWQGIGEKVFFMEGRSYTKHISLQNMPRINELKAQVVENMKEGQQAGIMQQEISLAAGKAYEVRSVTKVSAPVTLKVSLTDKEGSLIYAQADFKLTPSNEWATNRVILTPSRGDADGCIRFTFTERAEVTFGAVSMMPEDNFHGMRRDVVENLKAIGPKLLRWPGGNFAGEYRWKDGLLSSDERGPLQAAREIETQPFSEGFDYHEINTDDFIALCREVGAEPMLTINLAWSTPEESAEWVQYCNGTADTEDGKKRAERGHEEPYNVHFWSLGNEMGYGHMEGPSGPEGYAKMAEQHADKMREATTDLEFVSSGPYPNANWAKYSAAYLADKVKNRSLHTYNGGGRHFTTDEDIRKSYEGITHSADDLAKLAERMRQSLDETGKPLHISFDEWNQWYTWNRPSCVSDGIYTARVMHFFINRSTELDIPLVCYFQPINEGAIEVTPQGSRLTANGQVFSMMKEHQDGKRCKVSDNDDYSTAATLRGDTLTVTLVNADYDKNRTFSFSIKGRLLDSSLLTADDVTPYTYFTPTSLDIKTERRGVTATLPPHSTALFRLKLKK